MVSGRVLMNKVLGLFRNSTEKNKLYLPGIMVYTFNPRVQEPERRRWQHLSQPEVYDEFKIKQKIINGCKLILTERRNEITHICFKNAQFL